MPKIKKPNWKIALLFAVIIVTIVTSFAFVFYGPTAAFVGVITVCGLAALVIAIYQWVDLRLMYRSDNWRNTYDAAETRKAADTRIDDADDSGATVAVHESEKSVQGRIAEIQKDP